MAAPSLPGSRRRAGSGRPAEAPPAGKPSAKSPKPGGKKPTAANSSAFHYFSNRNLIPACKQDKDRIHKECDTEEGKERSKVSHKNAKLDERHATSSAVRVMKLRMINAVRAIDKLGKVRSGYKASSANQWMEDHCQGLWNKPGGTRKDGTSNTEEFKEQIQEKVDEAITQLQNVQGQVLDKMRNFPMNYFKAHGTEVLEGAAQKASQRIAVARFPLLAQLLARASFWETAGTLLGNVAGAVVTGDMEKQYEALEKLLEEARQKLEEYQRLLKSGLEDAMASMMAALAMANPCIKARKCLLVPYKDSDKTAKGNGCCPGQTGHHVLPDAMFKRYEPETDPQTQKTDMKAQGPRKCWEKYKHGDAPTICLEGTTNRVTNGS
ncbi:MAG: hypothetical protein RLZZ618_4162, partial [Pseudomonadota bacterium]